jgi:hypothetical protein
MAWAEAGEGVCPGKKQGWQGLVWAMLLIRAIPILWVMLVSFLEQTAVLLNKHENILPKMLSA